MRAIQRSLVMAGAAMFLFAATAQAQFTLGVKGGLNSAKLADLESGVSSSAETGFQGGAFLDIGFGSAFHIQPEVLYSGRKSGADDQIFKQSFVEIPLLFKAAFGSGLFQPALYAGPTLSFETDCKITSVLGGDISCDDPLLGTDTNNTNWAIAFGGELDVALGPVILIGDIRYNLGLSDISSSDSGKWNFWSFMLGLGFGLGRH